MYVTVEVTLHLHSVIVDNYCFSFVPFVVFLQLIVRLVKLVLFCILQFSVMNLNSCILHLESHNLTLTEVVSKAENRPLLRLLVASSATHSYWYKPEIMMMMMIPFCYNYCAYRFRFFSLF